MNNDETKEDLLAQEEDDDQEKCPICSRLNCPGALDHCEHFFGAYWDGEIIWSEQFDNFSELWHNFYASFSELGESLPAFMKTAKKYAKTNKYVSTIVQLASDDETATSALMKLVDFDFGPRIITGGMLSGEGFSCYLKDLAPISDVTDMLNVVHHLLNCEKDRAGHGSGGNG